jgi:hypothetical protein
MSVKYSLGHVIKSDDFDFLMDSKLYAQNIRDEIDALSRQRDDEYRAMVDELRQQTQAKFEQELLEYKQVIDQNVRRYLDELAETITNRVNHIMYELVEQKFDVKYVKCLIENEIEHSFEVDKIVVFANQNTVAALEDELLHLSDKVKFSIDESIEDNICICESKFYKMKINIQDIKQKILNQNKFEVESM